MCLREGCTVLSVDACLQVVCRLLPLGLQALNLRLKAIQGLSLLMQTLLAYAALTALFAKIFL